MVDAYSLYTAIVARPWLHAMRAIPSPPAPKGEVSIWDRVEELVRSQSMAKQCMVAVIRHQIGGESFTSMGRDL